MIRYKIFIFTIVATLLFLTYEILLPVKIIGIHKPGKTSTVVIVKNFPVTRAGKISWWRKNHNQLSKQFPFINSPENHRIVFFEAEYKKDSGTDQDSDLLCFKDMSDEANCISKDNRPLLIWRHPNGDTEYVTENVFQRFLQHF
ncbi:DUF943 family protein [Pantoea alhagi]|uniref:DUF943 family protein n=1 Tax=Pantoea alhagi TaxID=1891675 RepID=UPI00202AD2A0|nr:DUF943 family protein [Pantoea alhagi]URQ59881.1 DUF943 family protein [Pantoea alhagi]